jgi:hypothetical protein
VPAFVEHSFRGGFLLDETRLRKLKDIIESRETRRSDSKLLYRISRGDSYSYETESVDDVVNEDNEDWRRITRLDLKISYPEPHHAKEDDLRFILSFSDKDGCELHIAAEDRDRVLLLFSDLRDYIQHEITVTRTIDPENSRFLGMFISLGIITILALTVLYLIVQVEPETLKQALKNPDISAKLNFLIEQRGRPPSPRVMVSLGLSFVLALSSVFGSVAAVVRFIFPGNLFLFGKRKERFERRQRITGNLLWVVGVGLAVSIIAGLIVWRVTGSR